MPDHSIALTHLLVGSLFTRNLPDSDFWKCKWSSFWRQCEIVISPIRMHSEINWHWKSPACSADTWREHEGKLELAIRYSPINDVRRPRLNTCSNQSYLQLFKTHWPLNDHFCLHFQFNLDIDSKNKRTHNSEKSTLFQQIIKKTVAFFVPFHCNWSPKNLALFRRCGLIIKKFQPYHALQQPQWANCSVLGKR